MVFSTYNTFLSRVQLTILLSSSITASLQDMWILFTLIHFTRECLIAVHVRLFFLQIFGRMYGLIRHCMSIR